MALIHVIIPVYNTLSYVRESVESVLKQPCSNRIDICLVDDGSTDGSADLCDLMAERNENIYVIHQENAGVSVARNTGIDFFLERSRGNEDHSYIAFLDADDVWEGIFESNLIQKLKDNRNAEVLIFGCVRSDENLLKYSMPYLYEEEIMDGGNGVIWKTPGHFGANLYSIGLLKKYNIRFTKGLKYNEDLIFMMQCAFLAKKVQFMSELLHVYRQNTQSAMRQIIKIAPIDFYVPIIDAWIKSDMFLNEFSGSTHREIDAGIHLASVYFGDMAKEHYKKMGAAKELSKVKEHPYYYLFENMEKKSVGKKQFKEHDLLMKHPNIYKIKYNVIGMLETILRKAAKIKPIHDYRMKKRYPLTVEDIEKMKAK